MKKIRSYTRNIENYLQGKMNKDELEEFEASMEHHPVWASHWHTIKAQRRFLHEINEQTLTQKMEEWANQPNSPHIPPKEDSSL
jgi:hypothetical protein